MNSIFHPLDACCSYNEKVLTAMMMAKEKINNGKHFQKC